MNGNVGLALLAILRAQMAAQTAIARLAVQANNTEALTDANEMMAGINDALDQLKEAINGK